MSVFISNAQNTIKGNVSDNEKAPLSFANIILYNATNEKPVTGVISNDAGHYIFEDVANGSYWIETSMLGFETQKPDNFQLT